MLTHPATEKVVGQHQLQFISWGYDLKFEISPEDYHDPGRGHETWFELSEIELTEFHCIALLFLVPRDLGIFPRH